MKKRACIVLLLFLVVLFVAYLSLGEQPGMAASSSATRLPGVRVLSSLVDQYGPVTFDHAKHVSLAGKCDVCHHHANGAAATCAQCHNLSPAVFRKSVVSSFLPCSSCHSAPDPGNPSMPGLKVAYHQKCFACHRGMGDVGLAPKGCTELCHAKNKKARP